MTLTQSNQVVTLTSGGAVLELESPAAAITLEAAGNDKHFEHVQSVASSSWTVNHNLDKRPAVTVLDSMGREMEGDVTHVTTLQLTIQFSAPFSGTCYCN